MKHLHFSIFLFLGFISHLLSAQSVIYPIDASHSVISFSVGFAGGITSIDGRFDSFEGTIGYTDVNNPSTFFVTASIDVNSINTGDKDRDKDLQGVGYFNSEAYSNITFISKEAIKTADGFLVSGTFSMLGKTTEIKIPFLSKHNSSIVWVFGEPRIALEGNHIIDRLEYDIPKRGWNDILPSLGSMSLSKDVNIKLVIQGVGPSLSDLVLEKITAEGAPAGISLYNELENKETNKGTYTFGDRTLVGIVMKLARSGKGKDAIAVGEFMTSKNEKSFMAWFGLALANEFSGNKEEAIGFYEKALELNPKFSQAQSALNKLKQ